MILETVAEKLKNNSLLLIIIGITIILIAIGVIIYLVIKNKEKKGKVIEEEII